MMGVIKNMIKRIAKIDNELDKSFGVTDTDLQKKQDDVNKVMDVIHNIKNEMTNGKADEVDVLDLASKTAYIRRENEKKIMNPGTKKRKYKKGDVQHVRGLLEDENTLGRANQLLLHEKERLVKYADFEIITKMMPKLTESIRTYVDNIISPDDFSKKSLIKEYVGEISKDSKEKLMKNLEELDDTYDLENKIYFAIEESLKKGDHFLYVASVSDEMTRLYNPLNEDEDVIDVSETIRLDNSDMFSPDTCNMTSFLKENTDNISDMLNIFEDNTKIALTESDVEPIVSTLINQYTNITDSNSYIVNVLSEASKDSAGDVKKYFNAVENVNTGSMRKKDKKTNNFAELSGSIVRKLDPSKVIKIQSDSQCYGYYYIDVNYDSSLNDLKGMELPVATSGNNVGNNVSFNSSDFFTNQVSTNQKDAERSHKRRFIYDVFSERIIKGMDSQFINNNPQFKTMILDLLQTNDILNNSTKLNIIYIPPTKMVHFKIGDGVYGKSVLDDIIVLSKIYMATLMSNIMVRLLRGTDKRIWKFEVGLEDDIQQEVDAVIRDVSQRDVNLGTIQDIDYIFNTMGQFDDYVIPTYGGEDPLTLDIMDKQDIDLDDPFLEKLEKQILNTVGASSAFIESLEEVELAKSLSMMHQKFLRRVITIQKYYTPAVNKLYKLLYVNEYKNNVVDDNTDVVKMKKNKDGQIVQDTLHDMALLKILFPSPASLNMSNIIDQFSNAETIVDSIIKVLYGEAPPEFRGEDAELQETKHTEIKAKVIYELTKKYVTTIDWADIEKIKESTTRLVEKDYVLETPKENITE